MKTISLGYSPCPNDTFIFAALANGLIDCNGLKLDIHMHDVEELNRMACQGILDVTKLSIAALGWCQENYMLLDSGSALGRGCGPLIVAKPGLDLHGIYEAEVAVPGIMTTAHFLLSAYLDQKPRVRPMRFDRIMPAVAEGEYSYGIIIHEGRFTYQRYGLHNLLDLGEWWEQETGLPIPLGGIAIRRTLDEETASRINAAICESLSYAIHYPDGVQDYVRLHAREMETQVIREHIRLYVNEFSMTLGEEGEKAIRELLRIAAAKGIGPAPGNNIFASSAFL